MDKKKLKAIHRTENITATNENEREMPVKVFEVDDIVVIDIYYSNGKPYIRYFINKDDKEMLALRTDIKRLNFVFGDPFHYIGYYKKLRLVDATSKRIIENLGYNDVSTAIKDIYFVNSEKRKLGKTQAFLKQAKEDEKFFNEFRMPNNYKKFVDGLFYYNNKDYLFYNKKAHRSFVTCCQRNIDNMDYKLLKNNKEYECPFCHKNLTAKADGYYHQKWYDNLTQLEWTNCVDVIGDRVMVKYFIHHRKFNNKEVKIETTEMFRDMIRKARLTTYDTNMQKHVVIKGIYGYVSEEREPWFLYNAFSEKEFLEKLKGTPYEYCCFDKMKDYFRDTHIIGNWLTFYYKHTQIEKLIKVGWTDLVREQTRKFIIRKGNSLHEILGCTKEELNFLIQRTDNCICSRNIEFLRKIKKKVPHFGKEFVAAYDFYLSNCVGDEVKEHILSNYSYAKINNYLTKQKTNATMLNDYIRLLKLLKYPVNKDTLLPNNLINMHNKLTEEYNKKQENERKEAQKGFNKFLKQFHDKQWVDDKLGLFMRLPKEIDELNIEGSTLHHCVATYKQSVIDKKTTIFFIRKMSEPDKPYYTLEYKNGKIVQCRGLRNAAMTDEVKKFTEEFTDKIRLLAATA